MMIGTDAGGGTFYVRELSRHREAGIAAWDVMRMATSETAHIMGMGDLMGRIANGYEADLVVLEGDPVADIIAAARVYGVVNNGKLLLGRLTLRRDQRAHGQLAPSARLSRYGAGRGLSPLDRFGRS